MTKVHSEKWILGLALITACGSSPLFNHLSAEQAKANGETASTTGNGDCTVEFTKTGLCGHFRWSTLPVNRSAVGEAVLVLSPKATPAVTAAPSKDGKALSVAANFLMPAHGHDDDNDEVPVVSAAVGPAAKAIKGVYLVSAVTPIMRGDWELEVYLKDGDTVVETQKFKVKVP